MKKSRQQVAFARELRQKQTEAERALWMRLRNKQLEGIKFRRQQPIGLYIVDFVSFERKLIVEINGGQHDAKEMGRRDEERITWLKERGYQVLRFWNNEVLMNMKGVLERIGEFLR